MAHYSANFRARFPITVDNVGGGAGASDIQITIPTKWDDFWTSIEATGYDVIVTDADGVTLLTFERSSFTYASRTLVLDIDNYTLPAEGTCLLWLYYDYSSATDLSSSFVLGASKTGYIDLSRPMERKKIVSMDAEPSGRSRPSFEVHKEPNTETDLFFGPFEAGVLAPSVSSYSGRTNWEEIDYVQFGVENAGVESATEFDETKTRFIQDKDGNLYVKTRIKAGSSGSNRTAHLKCGTIDPSALSRIIEKKCFIYNKSLVET